MGFLFGAWLLFATAPLQPQEKNEAEQLLQKAERAMSTGSYLKFSFKTELKEFTETPIGGGRMLGEVGMGAVEIRPGNRIRIDGRIKVEGLKRFEPIPDLGAKAAWMILDSDGRSARVTPYERPSVVDVPSPARLKSDFIYLALRLGVDGAAADAVKELTLQDDDSKSRATGGAPSPRETDARKRVRISEATILGTESIAGSDALKLQYKVLGGPGPDVPIVTLWLDPKTHRPVKWASRAAGPGRESTRQEIYFDLTDHDPIEP